MRTWLQRLQTSRAARNAGASYLAFVSTSIYSLVSIPVAVHFLDPEEIGLWLIVNGVIGYLLWMDAGIGDATGRKIADAVAKGDQAEINRWWTTSMVVLGGLGMLTALVALACAPFLSGWLKIDAPKQADAIWLFVGGGLVAAFGTPMRAYPGLLLAQHRFHWVSIVQAIIPWIQLLVFFLLLRSGFGVRSYLPSLALSQAAGWLIWIFVVHGKNNAFRFDKRGFEKARVVSLFQFGGSVAALGIVSAILASLPAMILARAGGLGQVPVYAFTARGVSMLAQLSHRTTHAFYPGMQRLFVAGDRLEFARRMERVLSATVGIGLATAAVALVFNPALISWLAGPGYYAGTWANVWFAIGLIVAGITGGFTNLLQISGNMGRISAVALLQLILGAVVGWFAYLHFGLAGLAATFAVLPPTCKGLYAWSRGARNCGYGFLKIGGKSALLALLTSALVLAAGFAADHPVMPAAGVLLLFDRSMVLPAWPDIFLALAIGIPGTLLAVRELLRLGKSC